MEARLGLGHPRYKAVVERIDQLDRELSKSDLKFVDSQMMVSEEKLKAAEHRVDELTRYIQANGADSRKLNTQLAQYERLQAEVQQTRGRLDYINARIRELDMSQDMRAMNVMLVEAATEPIAPFSPNSAKVLKMSFAFGVILGLTLAVMLEVIDDRMRSADQMTSALGLPILGIIPESEPLQGEELARIMERETDSPMVEAVRTFRTAVLFGVPEGQSRTILVTSPTPGDGKSTIAASFAESLAQSGKKTLLLDADMRKPRVNAIFGGTGSAEVGLSSIVTGRATIDEATQRSPVENLDLIPCGPLPPNPAELLNSEAFRKLLATLGEKYDHIVIDAPPVLLVSDPRILSAICDCTVLVLRADKCRRRLANHAKEALRSVGGRLLGIVVNAAPQRGQNYGYSNSYGYYGYYGYGYKYGEDTKSKKAKAKKPQVVAK
jgi:polysaccharide biosynthesis transport protein